MSRIAELLERAREGLVTLDPEAMAAAADEIRRLRRRIARLHEAIGREEAERLMAALDAEAES